MKAVDDELASLRNEIAGVWAQVPEIQTLLTRFREQAETVENFDPVQELIQNLIASSETTAASAMWAATILGSRPDLQQAMRDETLPIENFIQELLRVYPPVPFVTRYATQDLSAGNVNFKKGEALIVSILGLHYSSFWKEPRTFNPYRFSEEQICLRDHYMPFLIGARSCGGRKLAEMELRVATKVLLEKFLLHIPNPAKVSFSYGLSFRPENADLELIQNSQLKKLASK